MQGDYRVQITTKRIRYDFTLREKFTLIQGDSGTGKSMLYDLIELSYRQPWVKLTCPAECLPAIYLGENWLHALKTTHSSILFFDQNDACVASKAFADTALASDNYFVFLTREPLPHIPASLQGIYERCTIRTIRTLVPRNR